MSHFAFNLGQTAEDSYVYKYLAEFYRVNIQIVMNVKFT